MRVVFWGTPQFGLQVLEALLDGKSEVVGVVTQPDRPAGRGRRTTPPPVKVAAEREGIPVLQPDKPRGDAFLAELRRLDAEVSVVAAYGEILRQEVLDLPPRGSINVHASLLPKLRGAAPVNWSIINGCEATGVTIMRMVEQLDAGPIILQARCAIPPRGTAGALAARLAVLGGEAILEALSLLESGAAQERIQDEGQATYASKLTTELVRIDWGGQAEQIDRWIRGADPAPAAWSELGGQRVRLFSPELTTQTSNEEPGTVVSADPRGGLTVATGSACLAIGEVQPAAKRRMTTSEWIRGRGVSVDQRFG